MKKRYLFILFLLLIFFVVFVSLSPKGTFAYYQTNVSGAVNAVTASYGGEVEIVSETHTFLPADNEVIDEIKFYVKNYTGTDQSPTTISQVYMSYKLAFTLPSWGSGCTNPVSYKLYSVNEGTNAETEVTLTNNQTSDINFTLLSSQKHYYKLKVYWDTTNNSVSCYAGKNGSVSIDAELKQRNV